MPDFMTDWWFLGLMAGLLCALVLTIPLLLIVVLVVLPRYRERRREYLNELARRLAEKAKQTGRSVTLNPMSPRDRRVVHLALQNDTSVETRSQGQGYYRKMLILPGARRGNRPSPPSQE